MLVEVAPYMDSCAISVRALHAVCSKRPLRCIGVIVGGRNVFDKVERNDNFIVLNESSSRNVNTLGLPLSPSTMHTICNHHRERSGLKKCVSVP